MNPIEAAELLAHASAFDNRQPSTAAAKAWAAALRDVPLDETTLEAVARYYTTDDPNATGQRWIQPHHVRAHRKAIRSQRLEGFQYVPTPGHTDYLTDLRAQIAAVADGRREAVPALPAAPRRDYDPETAFAGILPRPPKGDTPAEPQRAETPEETRAREFAEAQGYLLVISDDAREDAITRAHAQLGPHAERRDIVLLAAKLANAQPEPARPDKATADRVAAQGCPNGCPLGTHEHPCHFAEAS